MKIKFSFCGYLVDPTRSQLEKNGEITALHKKAMSVLVLLAERAGTVVSQDDIMNEIWGERVVAQNSIQRCIAQIRKALNDSSKEQRYIKTHPKLGYSLDAQVTWHNETQVEIADEIDETPETKLNQSHWVGMFAIVSILLIMTYFALKRDSLPHYEKLTQLTTSDGKETNPIYSTDGNYIVFHRYSDTQLHHLWAKRVGSSDEVQLTAIPAQYGSIAWGQDGSELIMSVELKNNYDTPCWQVLTIDFAEAIQSPVAGKKRTECMLSPILVPRWQSGSHLTYITYQGDEKLKELHRLDTRSRNVESLYKAPKRSIYSYDYSFEKKHFAVVSRNSNKQHFIEKVSQDGMQLSIAPLVLNDNSHDEYFNITFHPSGEYLITYTNKGVFALFFDGSMRKLNTLSRTNLSDPSIHPFENKMLAIESLFDQDILRVLLDNSDSSKLYHPIYRSNRLDADATFNPKSSQVAFISDRSGENQLWLSQTGKATQLTHEPHGVQLGSYRWAPDGKMLAYISHNELKIINVNGDDYKIETPFRVTRVLQWQDPDRILLLANDAHESKLYWVRLDAKYDAQLDHLALNIPLIKWLSFTPNGDFFYLDTEHKVWLVEQGKTRAQFVTINSNSSILALKGENLYGVNSNNELWMFNAKLNELEIIKRFAENVRYVSDINDNAALVTKSHNHSMDIVEFSEGN